MHTDKLSYKQELVLKKSLQLIKEAVEGEREDELFYDYLISIAKDSRDKEIIASIRDDERKHNRMFRKIYKDFTGMDIPMSNDTNFKKPSSYVEGIEMALFGELAAVEKYRVIRQGLPNGPYRDMLFEIITDELKHASKYNYLYTKNRTHNLDSMGMNCNMSNKNVDMNMPNKNMEMDMNMVNKNKHMDICMDMGMNMGADIKMIKSKKTYTPDEWVMYISPLVKMALEESKQGINAEHLFQEYILSGVLVGLGKTPMEAIETVENWEKTGESKLLKESKMKK